jgi:phosphoribosylglycinamide formyltransferase 1
MTRTQINPIRVAVLISGGGRTLKNLLDLASEEDLPVDVHLVISSSGSAGGLRFAHEANIATAVFDRKQFASDADYGTAIFDACRAAGVDYVVMAGFLKLAPVPEDFANRVVNIHPSLLPAFGGHGMYGHRVHQAVLDYGAKVSGCTVHFVDNEYDRGPVVWQQPVPVFPDDTADSLGARVFSAEKEAFPHVLKLLAGGKIRVEGRKVSIVGKER